MPSGVGEFETYDALAYTIKDLVRHKQIIKEVAAGLFKIDLTDKVFYWYGSADGDVELGAELEKLPRAFVVRMTGKKTKGKAPYASDLYSAILKDAGTNIRLRSDKQLSDHGLKLWKKMVALGHKVSVYSASEPGKTFQSFETPVKLDVFFKHDDTSYEDFQYVLSENMDRYCSMRADFNLRKLHEGNELTKRALVEQDHKCCEG
jgi:hypothetical protein